jgi:serine/threonine-protein kinase
MEEKLPPTIDYVPLSSHPGRGKLSAPTSPGGLLVPVPGYEVVRELGRGGMGVVYEARHKGSGERVALKVIVPAQPATERALQLFLREASVLSQLNHPRIVRFKELGLAGGQLFLAMEYVEAVDLPRTLAGQLASARVRTYCAIICQLLEALGYAHQAGVVHRDIKPSNLLVARQGKKLATKVADFGLAKHYQTAGWSGLSGEGETLGTVAFMAPEQFQNSRSARPAADIYAAGAAFYFYLSGHAPQSRPAWQEPPPLGSRCPGLPEGLAAVVHQALAREPAQRFASAAAMHRALLPYARKKTGPD